MNAGRGQAMSAWTLESTSTLRRAGGGPLRPGGLRLTGQALAACDFAPGSRILDAGCGTGVTSRYLADQHRLSVFGIDTSATLLGAARDQDSALALARGTLDTLPFASASFDGIICECTLSQTRPAIVLAEFARVLRPGGQLVLTDLYSRSPAVEQPAATPTKEQTLALLEATGFKLSLWQDRTADLKRLAVDLIMAPGDCADNLRGWQPGNAGDPKLNERTAWRNLGYYLLVARRTDV